jgi:hypothetical protein
VARETFTENGKPIQGKLILVSRFEARFCRGDLGRAGEHKTTGATTLAGALGKRAYKLPSRSCDDAS